MPTVEIGWEGPGETAHIAVIFSSVPPERQHETGQTGADVMWASDGESLRPHVSWPG